MLSYPDFKAKKLVIVFTKEGEHFSFRNDNLVVKNSDDAVILQETCYRILSLWIVGSGSISSGLLERSKRFGFSLYCLNYNFRPVGIWSAETEGNTLLRQKQYQYQSLDIAKQITHNKISNQLSVLKSVRKKSDDQKIAIHKIQGYLPAIDDITELDQLMGIEGTAAKLYFKNWFDNIDWIGRKPRTKCNPVNTLLDIGYTQLFYFIESLLNLYGFDLYKGFLHQTFYQRKSLVCDLQEPFRPIIDKSIKHAYNLGQFKEDDFTERKGQFTLDYKVAKPYVSWILSDLLKHKDEIFLYTQAFYRAFIRGKPIGEFPVFNYLAD